MSSSTNGQNAKKRFRLPENKKIAPKTFILDFWGDFSHFRQPETFAKLGS
jgi:hypothetical protein